MRHGKLVTQEASMAKTEREIKNRQLAAMEHAKANGIYFETLQEAERLSLGEVTNRLIKLYENPYQMSDLDMFRGKRLMARAWRLGVKNPYTLLSKEEKL